MLTHILDAVAGRVKIVRFTGVQDRLKLPAAGVEIIVPPYIDEIFGNQHDVIDLVIRVIRVDIKINVADPFEAAQVVLQRQSLSSRP